MIIDELQKIGIGTIHIVNEYTRSKRLDLQSNIGTVSVLSVRLPVADNGISVPSPNTKLAVGVPYKEYSMSKESQTNSIVSYNSRLAQGPPTVTVSRIRVSEHPVFEETVSEIDNFRSNIDLLGIHFSG